MDFSLLSSTYSSAQQALISANNTCVRRHVPLPDKFGNCVKMTSSVILQYLSKQAYFHHFLWTYLFFADFCLYFTLLFCQDGQKMRGYKEKKTFFFSVENVVRSERLQITRVTCIAHLYGRFLNTPDSNFVPVGAICLLASYRVPIESLKGFLSQRRVLHVSKHNDIVYTKYM